MRGQLKWRTLGRFKKWDLGTAWTTGLGGRSKNNYRLLDPGASYFSVPFSRHFNLILIL